MRSVKSWSELRAHAALLLAPVTAFGAVVGGDLVTPHEAWREVPMPPGFQVVITETEGPLFADAEGRTLYKWPHHKHRNGYSGETPGNPACYDEVITVTAGLMSPYPPGIELPEVEQRPSCAELWPPVLAAADDLGVGDWSIIERRDGTLQWAYEEQPLYRSIRDAQPGDVLGGTRRRYGGDSPAYRVPVSPPPLLPPGFQIRTTSIGRMLATDRARAVYAYAGDPDDCTDGSGENFEPLIAPALARAQGEWAPVERAPGMLQWSFRGAPLFTYALDQESWGQQGSDIPGWRNVFTQRAPALPERFTVQETLAGEVLASPEGRTIYFYYCGEDSADQLACDHPGDTQVYRLAMCGGGDPERCAEYWPYVEASPGEESTSRTWSIVTIDPRTGRFAADGAPGSKRVWAYRDRPVYTFGQDKKPGDVNGGGTGEWRGQRNGLRAFWLRDDFMRGIL